MADHDGRGPVAKVRARLFGRGASIARRVLALLMLIVVLLVVTGISALVVQARQQSEDKAQAQALGVAQSFANAPGTVRAMTSSDPTASLQPRTDRVRKLSGVGIVTTYDTRGIRWSSSPRPDLIGEHVIGPYKKAARGTPFVQNFTGNLGRQVNAVVPVFGPRHKVVGIVSVGITVEKVNAVVGSQLPVLLGSGAAALVLAAGGAALIGARLRRDTHGLGPAAMSRMYEHHDAVLHAVREGVLVVGADGRLPLVNDEARRLLGVPLGAEYRRLAELELPAEISELLTSGRLATDELHLVGGRLLTVNVRPTAPYGGPSGTVATLRDTTELRRLSGRAEGARERLMLLYDAGLNIGTSLDVQRTAEELAEATVPRFADLVTIDLAEPLLRDDEPEAKTLVLSRAAVRGTGAGGETGKAGKAGGAGGAGTDSAGTRLGERVGYPQGSPQAQVLETAEAVLEADLRQAPERAAPGSDAYGEPLAPEECAEAHSLLVIPLRARGTVIGLVSFWRVHRAEAFEPDDVRLSEELAGHAAVCIDNAHRYAREHATAVTLQRSLLPRGLPQQNALDVAHRYLPSHSGVGGDWFDVLPLSGARVALVMGDVVGHGLHAAATMGRLRTAVHNFSSLDLSPDELLERLDELVTRLDQDEDGVDDGNPVTGATCLYAVYDPVTGRATVASAGHPGPAVVHPDGTVRLPDVPTSPPLGTGGNPFGTVDLELPEGTRLVLYTDGLLEDRHRTPGAGTELLRNALAEASDQSPEDMCRAVFESVRPEQPEDDVALLVARSRLLGPDEVAEWDLPQDPAAVPRIRETCREQLETWGLEDFAFTTELIVSELATNAIRYGAEPVRVRLLRDRQLICEVSDGSSTSPHLRRAATTDEGGRGLFLIAQYAQRWGTRYTARGKVIWAEQSLQNGQSEPAVELSGDDLLAQWDDVAW